MQKPNNLAYDLRRFETHSQPKTRPQFKVVRQKEQARRTRNLIAKSAVCVVIFWVGIIGIIFSQVSITEITMNITSQTQKLEQLQSEYRTLTAELESSMALNNIESTVTRERGMSKLRDDQVTYVAFSESESVDTVEKHDDSLLGQIKSAIERVMEYLKPSDNTME